MKKYTIVIMFGLVLILSTIAVIQAQNIKCGDSICDTLEKKSVNLCPKDCSQKVDLNVNEKDIDNSELQKFTITKYNGVNVDVLIDSSGIDKTKPVNIYVSYHGTAIYDTKILEAAKITIDNTKKVVPDGNNLFVSIVYPEESKIAGTNIKESEAGLLWAMNDMPNIFGITIDKTVLIGHSQGAYIVAILNTLHKTDGVVSNSPGPLDMELLCNRVEKGGYPKDEAKQYLCETMKQQYGSVLINPKSYKDRSLMSFVSGHKAPILFIQGMKDDNKIQLELWPIFKSKMQNCTDCATIKFVDISKGKHAAGFNTAKGIAEIKDFIALLNTKDSTGKNNKTVSEIIEGEILPEIKLKPTNLQGGPQLSGGWLKDKCGDNICDILEKKNINLCSKDCSNKVDLNVNQIEVDNSANTVLQTSTLSECSENISSMIKKIFITIQEILSNTSNFGFGGSTGDTNNESSDNYVQQTPSSTFSFGYLNARNSAKYYKDLGVEWVRLDMPWKLVQPSSGSNYSWGGMEGRWEYAQFSKQTNFVITLTQLGVNMHAKGEERFQKDKFSYLPAETGEYNRQDWLNLVKAVVERYDGDGKDDSPNLSQPIKYYEVENESGLHTEMADYAEFFEITHDAIKEACADCSVVMSGNAGKLFKDLEGDKSQIDDRMYLIFKKIADDGRQDILTHYDFHWNKELKGYDPYEIVKYLKSKLSELKFDTSKITFWITEGGTYSGKPAVPSILPAQSETEQASGVAKHFVAAFGSGVDKFFWAYGIKEGFQYKCSLFDYTGLIYDGNIVPKMPNGQNLPGIEDENWEKCADTSDLGDGVKKLAYYSYKKIVEILGGVDSVQTIQRIEDGIHIYKFTKSGKNIWVAWNDGTTSKTTSISGITGTKVTVITSVPKYNSGKEVTDYTTAFTTETKTITNGAVQLNLTSVPMYILEY